MRCARCCILTASLGGGIIPAVGTWLHHLLSQPPPKNSARRIVNLARRRTPMTKLRTCGLFTFVLAPSRKGVYMMIKTFTVGIIASALFALVGSAHAQDPDRSPVLLGAAGHFVILTKAGITDVPTSAVTGNVGTSPITGAADLLTCKEVTGTIYSVNAAGPFPCSVKNPTLLTTAVLDMQHAYTNRRRTKNSRFHQSGRRKYWRVDTHPWPLQMGHQCKNTNGGYYLGCYR